MYVIQLMFIHVSEKCYQEWFIVRTFTSIDILNIFTEIPRLSY